MTTPPSDDEAQPRFIYGKHPDQVDKWESETPTGTRLPRKLIDGRKRKTRRSRDDG